MGAGMKLTMVLIPQGCYAKGIRMLMDSLGLRLGKEWVLQLCMHQCEVLDMVYLDHTLVNLFLLSGAPGAVVVHDFTQSSQELIDVLCKQLSALPEAVEVYVVATDSQGFNVFPLEFLAWSTTVHSKEVEHGSGGTGTGSRD